MSSHGLQGEWLSLEDLAQIDFFKGSKRPYTLKLSANLGNPEQGEPPIKAVVKRHYQKGEIICKAGDYGSTAFLLLEGSAIASIPTQASGTAVAGRTERARDFLRTLFRRRTQANDNSQPSDADLGEVGRYALMTCDSPPLPQTLRAGDLFGIDTCINFYPREATVEAGEPCVVLEMLRSVLDTIRFFGGASAGRIEDSYGRFAVRSQIYRSSMFRDLGSEEMDWLAEQAELLTPGSDSVRDNVLFSEGSVSDAIYLVHSGTVKLSQQRGGGEVILGYVGRGTIFGIEEVLPHRRAIQLRLVCVSHAQDVSPVELGASTTIGRASSCEVVLAGDRTISGKHCRIEQRDTGLHLVDLGSANGTRLNGELVQEVLLTAGDLLEIGAFTLRLENSPLDTTALRRVRLTTATGMDNFEVVRLRSSSLRQLAERNPQFLGRATMVAQAVDAATVRPATDQGLVDQFVELGLYNSQNTLLIDLDRCTRCDQCVRACATAHDGVARFTRDGPRFGNYLVTMACRSCTDPKCMIGCPVGSIRRRDSLEIHIEDWCIGCQSCAKNCPFGNINMIDRISAQPAIPDAPKLPPMATVCDLCAGYEGPNCVYACPHDAAIRVEPGSFLSIADLR